jgi:hypothetical protein
VVRFALQNAASVAGSDADHRGHDHRKAGKEERRPAMPAGGDMDDMYLDGLFLSDCF